MTQPYDHRADDSSPSDDTPEVADAVAPDGPDAVAPDAPDAVAPEPEPQPAPEPEPQSFGDERVDRAVERLAELDQREVGDHAEVFDDIHGQLRDALEEAAVDTSPP